MNKGPVPGAEKQNDPGDHTGHRSRLRDDFRNFGVDFMKDYEILEFLLFYCIPRKDTRPIARRLLNKFGSLSAVLDASPEALAKTEGVGENTAILLSVLPAIAGRYLTDRAKSSVSCLSTCRDVKEYLKNFFIGRRTECFYLLCLDKNRSPVCCHMLNEGGEYNVDVNIRKLGQLTADARAAYVIVAHNHPNGSAIPSENDIDLTGNIAAVVNAMGARFEDHIIFGKSEDFSMAEGGVYYSRFFR